MGKMKTRIVKLMRLVVTLLSAGVDKLETEDYVIEKLTLVFRWHEIPGDISFESWLVSRIVELESQLEKSKHHADCGIQAGGECDCSLLNVD